uniref:peptidylprolyl isomerase n=1 Tax=Zooxanthella nutricula TaxID=1333877 RepID=A0A6U6PWZ2_9DINO
MTIIEELDEDGNVIEADDEAARACKAKIADMEEKEKQRVEKQFALAEEHKAEGNKLLAEGEYAGAVKSYEKSRTELNMVGNEEEARKRHKRDCFALDLNIALAKLKLQDYEAVKQNCTSALIHDAKSVKALYRRGIAQAALARGAALFQEAEAKGAIADFEAALAVEPSNAECARELGKLRAELRAHEKDLHQKQRDTWGQVFGGKTVIEGEEDAPPDEPLPTVRPCVNTDKHLIVSLEGASAVGEGGAKLGPLQLDLREAWAVGVAGGNAASRTSLARLFTSEAKTTSGRVVIHEKPRKPGKRGEKVEPLDRKMLFGALAALIAMLASTEFAAVGAVHLWIMRVFGALGLGILRLLFMIGREEPLTLRAEVAHRGAVLPAMATVEELIADQLARQIAPEERRQRTIAMLAAAGFQGTGEADGTPAKYVEAGLRFGKLPEEQKRLVQIVRCLAARPEVLIFDDALAGLPLDMQARVLRMAKRMKQECKVSVLLMSDDLDAVCYIADTMAVIGQDGLFCEKGPALEVLETPRHDETRAAIAAELSRMGRKAVNGGPLQAQCKELIGNAAIDGAWLPPLYK